MGQDLSLIREWHLKDIWLNADQAVSLGTGLCCRDKKFHCLKCTWAGQGIHLLKMMARMAMAAITKKARPPSAEPTISGSRSCTISERSPGKQDTHTHTDAEDRNCAVSLLLTKMSLIIPALPALCSPVTVLLQHPLSYIWKTSVPSESTFSLFPGPLTADKTLKHRLALHLGCIPLSPINVACQHLWSIPNGWWPRWKASSCTYAYVQSTCVSCVPPVF